MTLVKYYAKKQKGYDLYQALTYIGDVLCRSLD